MGQDANVHEGKGTRLDTGLRSVLHRHPVRVCVHGRKGRVGSGSSPHPAPLASASVSAKWARVTNSTPPINHGLFVCSLFFDRTALFQLYHGGDIMYKM